MGKGRSGGKRDSRFASFHLDCGRSLAIYSYGVDVNFAQTALNDRRTCKGRHFLAPLTLFPPSDRAELPTENVARREALLSRPPTYRELRLPPVIIIKIQCKRCSSLQMFIRRDGHTKDGMLIPEMAFSRDDHIRDSLLLDMAITTLARDVVHTGDGINLISDRFRIVDCHYIL